MISPLGRHNNPATPLGFYYSIEYNGGSRPRLCCDIPAGLTIQDDAFTRDYVPNYNLLELRPFCVT